MPSCTIRRLNCGFRIADFGLNDKKTAKAKTTPSGKPIATIATKPASGLPFGAVAVSSFSSFAASQSAICNPQ